MALYEDGGVTSTARTRSTNAQKAQAYDDMVAARREEDAITRGRDMGFQEALQEQIRQQQIQDSMQQQGYANYLRRQQEAATAPSPLENLGGFMRDKANGLADYIVDAITPRPSVEAQEAARRAQETQAIEQLLNQQTEGK